MTFLTFLDTYKWPLLFYLAVIILIYLNRKRFTFEAKIIAILKTKLGIAFINKTAGKHPRTFTVLGYIGLVLGILGMIGAAAYIIYQFVYMFLVPTAPPAISPALPGLPIPGTGIVIPFFQGLIALFIAVALHEFSHGLVARAHHIPIKSTGFVMFGPIPGAFVDPDEKKLKAAKVNAKASVFAAGPFANMVLAAVAVGVLLLLSLFNPVFEDVVQYNGITFSYVMNASPASQAGLTTGVIYTGIDGKKLETVSDFVTYVDDRQPGDIVTLSSANATYPVVLGKHPTSGKAYLGVGIAQAQDINKQSPLYVSYLILEWFVVLFWWLFILNVGLGLVNLLPVGPLDGGRIFEAYLTTWIGKKKSYTIWSTVSYIGFIVLVLLLIFPFIRSAF